MIRKLVNKSSHPGGALQTTIYIIKTKMTNPSTLKHREEPQDPWTDIAGRNEQIAKLIRKPGLDRGQPNYYWSDYHFDIRKISENLKLDKALQNDPQYQAILKASDNNPLNYEVELRAREIIIDKLMPLVSALPKIEIKDHNPQFVEGSGDSYGMDPHDVSELVGLLLLATKGVGSKEFNLTEKDFEDASKMAETLKGRNKPNFNSMRENMRGEELRALVTAAYENNRKELLKLPATAEEPKAPKNAEAEHTEEFIDKLVLHNAGLTDVAKEFLVNTARAQRGPWCVKDGVPKVEQNEGTITVTSEGGSKSYYYIPNLPHPQPKEEKINKGLPPSFDFTDSRNIARARKRGFKV